MPLSGIGAIGFTGDILDIEAAEKLPNKLAERLPNRLAEKLSNSIIGTLTPAEKAFLDSVLSFFDEREWFTNAQVREATGKSDGSVKRFLRNLTAKGAFEAKGETRDRQYRLS